MPKPKITNITKRYQIKQIIEINLKIMSYIIYILATIAPFLVRTQMYVA